MQTASPPSTCSSDPSLVRAQAGARRAWGIAPGRELACGAVGPRAGDVESIAEIVAEAAGLDLPHEASIRPGDDTPSTAASRNGAPAGPTRRRQGYRGDAHDHRGPGRSSQVSEGHDMDHYAADAAAVVEHLDLRNAVHVGHSTGGGEATHYVARHGQRQGRVAKLVL